jgi:hypothetical protein
MSNSDSETQICSACGQEKVLSLFPKWRLKCKACKSAENSARLKERYKSDPKFVEATKQRAADWQRENAEKSNEYHRRRHAAKVAAGDREYLLKSSEATKRYYRSEKGKAAAAAREARYVASGQDKAWRNARRQKPESRASELLAGARSRALKTDIECNLTFDDVYPAIAAGRCQKTGVLFDLTPHPGLRRHPLAPSIDRIDSAKGYTRDNIQIVCGWYNMAKQDLSEAEMLDFCRRVVDANHLASV